MTEADPRLNSSLNMYFVFVVTCDQVQVSALGSLSLRDAADDWEVFSGKS